MDTFLTESAEGTEKYGLKFSKKLKPQDTVFLTGELGSGKTTFVKGVASGLGVTARIISPTFIVVRIYKTKNERIKRIYHLDLYRLKNESEVKGIDLKDFLNDEAAVVIIEWPQFSINFVTKKIWKIEFINKSENKRQINVSYE